MPALIFLGILFGVAALSGVFLLMFSSVAFADPSRERHELTQEQARALLLRVSNRRIDPSDGRSPTFGELVQRGLLDDVRDGSTRSLVQ